MSNLNKIYHKGYRSGEWAKHLLPFLKRVRNKKWRKTAKNLFEFEEEVRTPKKRRLKKTQTPHFSCQNTLKFYKKNISCYKTFFVINVTLLLIFFSIFDVLKRNSDKKF